MAADAQIEIIIELQDKMSKQLKEVEGKLENFSKENQKATKSLTDSWNKGTAGLIAIGNAAATVDNIFSALTNLQIRLENATLRLTSAQESLADASTSVFRANRDLERAQRELASAEKTRFSNFDRWERAVLGLEAAQDRVTDASVQQERANRSLTIAQNNLARANNQVVGTYINIGVQSAGLLASLPNLIKQIDMLKFSLGSLALFGGIALAASIILDIPKTEKQTQALTELNKSWRELKLAINDAVGPGIALVLQSWTEIINNLNEALTFTIKQLNDMLTTFARVQRSIGIGPGLNKAPAGFNIGGIGPKIHDGIIKPDGTIIQTDPRDTLVAMKDIDTSVKGMGRGNGLTVYITGNNIYGVDAKDISRALLRELSRKVSI